MPEAGLSNRWREPREGRSGVLTMARDGPIATQAICKQGENSVRSQVRLDDSGMARPASVYGLRVATSRVRGGRDVTG